MGTGLCEMEDVGGVDGDGEEYDRIQIHIYCCISVHSFIDSGKYTGRIRRDVFGYHFVGFVSCQMIFIYLGYLTYTITISIMNEQNSKFIVIKGSYKYNVLSATGIIMLTVVKRVQRYMQIIVDGKYIINPL